MPKTECLNQHWFLDLDDASAKVEAWRQEYNEVRPHSAIGDRPPMALIAAVFRSPSGEGKPEILT